MGSRTFYISTFRPIRLKVTSNGAIQWENYLHTTKRNLKALVVHKNKHNLGPRAEVCKISNSKKNCSTCRHASQLAATLLHQLIDGLAGQVLHNNVQVGLVNLHTNWTKTRLDFNNSNTVDFKIIKTCTQNTHNMFLNLLKFSYHKKNLWNNFKK